MRYRFFTKFWHDGSDEDDAALARRLAAFFRSPIFRDAVLKPRSRKLAPTEENIAELLVPTDGYESSDFDWVVRRQRKTIAGRLSLTRNRIWTPPGFTSFVELRFSLSAGYEGGPFRDVEEVRDAALACMPIGRSPIGMVECDDEDDERATAKFDRFREIDDMAVPVSLEWVMVFHQDVVAAMGVDLRQAEVVSGVRVGRSGDYWWVLLCPEPLSFADGVGASALEEIDRALDLEAIQSRFRRQAG